MPGFYAERDALEKEGVYIGGWELRNVVRPKGTGTKRGIYGNVSDDIIDPGAAIQRDWSAAEERALLWKLDFRVLLPCFIIYLLAYIDRANLSNVKILQAGTPNSLEGGLHLQGVDFNWAVSIGYFTATALLMPSTILLKMISSKNFFPLCMVTFGTIVMSMAACKNAAGLLTARFFLGIPESGVVPCCIMYFSFWYRPEERALRIGGFYSAAALSQALSGFVALGLDDLNGRCGLSSWQWVFLIEGALPIALAIPTYFLLLTFPENSTALSERERHIAINRFGRGSARMTDVTWDTSAFIRLALRPSTYCFFLAYICLTMIAVSLGTFEPTILSVFMRFPIPKSNLYAAACNLVLIPFCWLWPLHSDYTGDRMWHYIIPFLLSVPCFGVWTYVGFHPDQTAVSNVSMYGLVFLGQLALIGQPILLSYRSATLYGAAEQAIGLASTVAGLQIASIIAPQMYPNRDAPYYVAGFSATCAVLAVSLVAYISLPYALLLEAAQRKKKTGHALPLRSLEDAERSQVSEAALAMIHAANEREELDALELQSQAKGIEERTVVEVEQANAETSRV